MYTTSLHKFLFLGQAVDSTLLCPISAIASQSANPTEDTLELTYHLLDYLGTQEEAVLNSTQEKWYWQHIAISVISVKQTHAAGLEDTSSFQATAPSHKTTAPSLTYYTLLNI